MAGIPCLKTPLPRRPDPKARAGSQYGHHEILEPREQRRDATRPDAEQNIVPAAGKRYPFPATKKGKPHYDKHGNCLGKS